MLWVRAGCGCTQDYSRFRILALRKQALLTYSVHIVGMVVGDPLATTRAATIHVCPASDNHMGCTLLGRKSVSTIDRQSCALYVHSTRVSFRSFTGSRHGRDCTHEGYGACVGSAALRIEQTPSPPSSRAQRGGIRPTPPPPPSLQKFWRILKPSFLEIAGPRFTGPEKQA